MCLRFSSGNVLINHQIYGAPHSQRPIDRTHIYGSFRKKGYPSIQRIIPFRIMKKSPSSYRGSGVPSKATSLDQKLDGISSGSHENSWFGIPPFLKAFWCVKFAVTWSSYTFKLHHRSPRTVGGFKKCFEKQGQTHEIAATGIAKMSTKQGRVRRLGKPTDNITDLSYLLWHLNSLSSSTLLLQDNALCWLCWWLILLSTTQVCSPLHAEPLEETNRQALLLGMRLLSTYSFTALITIDPTRKNCQTAMPTVWIGHRWVI